METLIQILRKALDSNVGEGWLYLPREKDWSLNSPAIILDIDEMDEAELDEEDFPLLAKQKRLVDTLDCSTIEDIVDVARRDIQDPPSDELLLEAFLYYYNYDAFLPEIGFKPPSTDHILFKLDLDFYNQLGEESPGSLCKKTECNRGKIAMSLYCKVHHFEMVKNKPCPFKH